jgi:glutaconyl-CoA/methylmalonyl-CoA decarboxylase subunit gamma
VNPPVEPIDDAGLQAFDSEFAPTATATHEPAPDRQAMRSRAILGLLATLVVIEAGPAILWLHGRFVSDSTVAAESAIPVPPPPASACLPAPAASTAAGPAPSTPSPRTEPAASTAAAPAAAAMAGLVSVSAPVPMRVFLKGKLVGTTEAETIMLPVGTHELEFSSDAVGYSARRTVTVQAGRTSAVRLDSPSGTIHVNASPWAEVWIDKQRIGETPIGNLQIPIGQHEVLFRHPDLGERRSTVLVTLKAPTRVSMDMRTK